jgi:hypothetical protein
MSVRLGISSPYADFNKLQQEECIYIHFSLMIVSIDATAMQKASDARLASQWE